MRDREEENSSHHHKAEVAVVTSLEIKGTEKREVEEEEGERGDTGEKREREGDVMEGEGREGEEERKSLQGMLDRERHNFKQRERQKIAKVSLTVSNVIV